MKFDVVWFTVEVMELLPLLYKLESQVRGGLSAGEMSKNGFSRLGLRVPDVRSILKRDLSWVHELTAAEQLKFWHFVYQNTTLYEVGSLAIYAYQYRVLSRQEFTRLRQWINRCDCWEHSDDLSKVYATVVEEHPDWILPWLRKWNRDKNSWKRRQSVVSLLEYAQKRNRVEPYKTLISFVEPLLFDKAYYVQKGVGWTLREIYNVYPKQTLSFLNQNFASIDPIAWSAATEKLNASDKKRLNLLRKKARAITS